MAVLDVLGRRWVLRILWELRSPATSFRDLQSRCGGMSSSVLAERLADLREMGVVHDAPQGGYGLTDEGHQLLDILLPLHDWAKRWHRRQRSAHKTA
jgi:DNA-binding HxlR family transcriptional regulator